MSKKVGGDRVLDVLSETVVDYTSVDLRGGPAPVALAPAAGESASRFVECRELGKGGLGVVLEAFDQDLRRSVALKRPRDDRMTSDSIVSLLREAQVTAQLDHPNVPAIHSLGIDEEGRPYFTMTCLGGLSLSQLLSARQADPELARQLTTGRLLRIFLQVGYAVAFAHARGVVHRDLKPSNIMVGEFGEVRLMDWGIAMVLERPDGEGDQRPVSLSESAGGSQTSGPAFTPGYAAPEQILGAPDQDRRADIYSLGATLFAMIGGRPPVKGRTVKEVLNATVAGKLTPLHELAPVSHRLEAIIDKSLALRPRDRYSSVLEMLADVEALLEGRPVKALKEGVLERVSKIYFGRNRRMARLTNFHIDMMTAASLGFGLLAGFLVPDHWADWATWPCLVFTLLACIPWSYALLRKERPDDPGVVMPFKEGISTTSSFAGKSRTSRTAAGHQGVPRAEKGSSAPLSPPSAGDEDTLGEEPTLTRDSASGEEPTLAPDSASGEEPTLARDDSGIESGGETLLPGDEEDPA